MIEISRVYLNVIFKKEQLSGDEFQKQYHIQHLERLGGDIYTEMWGLEFEDPKYETMFRLRFNLWSY